MKLPPLPEPEFRARWPGDPIGFGIEQVRAIQIAAARAALEEAARVCMAERYVALISNPLEDAKLQGMLYARNEMQCAIRAIKIEGEA